MRQSLCHALLLVALGCFHVAEGQTVEYDWASRSLQSWPHNVVQTGSATVTVHNVNDLLYQYTVKADCTQNQANPSDLIGQFLPQVPTKAADAVDACATNVNAATTAIDNERAAYNNVRLAPTVGSNCSTTSPCNIPLSATQDAWRASVEPLYEQTNSKIAAASLSCASDDVRVGNLATQQNEITVQRSRVLSPQHDYQATVTLIPDSSCTLTITQSYAGIQTQNGSQTATFSPGQARMAISVGPLFSQIQDRSYSVVSVPSGSGGTGAQNILQFNGNSSYTTYLTGLLNFNIPLSYDWINSERYGFALSTGPVVRVGGQSSTSAFGWFGGLSYRLYDLVYLSAGFHIGQFAGNPAGYNAPNQVVPQIHPPQPPKGVQLQGSPSRSASRPKTFRN